MEQVNKLYRSQKSKMIGGVAGGLSEYFNVDVVVIRLLFLLLFFFSGGGLLAYIILWIAIPQRPVTYTEANGMYPPQQEEKEIQSASRSTLGGIILIFLGVLFLLDNIIPMYHLHQFWPLILIFFGIFLIFPNLLQSNSNNHTNTINHES